ncbi:hypothetical protein TSAR_016985 [Trichomalopsis sarcophagae]|uniref:HIG1 domain-containing protein n=1 Tax=Trichomalopsis sarcophagae TaxID=543379 RepID=A0A232F3Z8_9HYME|nr:hypothetical protein TSAR_016985 [Trichomalopsis sarcophagae]
MSSDQPPATIPEFTSSYEEEGIGSGIVRQFQEKPIAMTGIVGMIGALGYGYNRYKTKGFLVSPSLFLMQLRVGAQAMVVGCITCGMIYNMVQQHLLKKKNEPEH